MCSRILGEANGSDVIKLTFHYSAPPSWATSPPLACVEKNPGPGQKKRGRKTRKDHQPLDHHLGEDEKKELKVPFDQGLGVNEIVRTTHMKEDCHSLALAI